MSCVSLRLFDHAIQYVGGGSCAPFRSRKCRPKANCKKASREIFAPEILSKQTRNLPLGNVGVELIMSGNNISHGPHVELISVIIYSVGLGDILRGPG